MKLLPWRQSRCCMIVQIFNQLRENNPTNWWERQNFSSSYWSRLRSLAWLLESKCLSSILVSQQGKLVCFPQFNNVQHRYCVWSSRFGHWHKIRLPDCLCIKLKKKKLITAPSGGWTQSCNRVPHMVLRGFNKTALQSLCYQVGMTFQPQTEQKPRGDMPQISQGPVTDQLAI